MGTAQYLSPEQARGAQVTAAPRTSTRSASSSTRCSPATVPFSGDSPVEIAMKHVNDARPTAVRARRLAFPPISTGSSCARSRRTRPTATERGGDATPTWLAIEAGLPIARETADAATAILAGTAAATAATQVLDGRRRRPPAPPRTAAALRSLRRPAQRRKRSISAMARRRRCSLAARGVAGWYVYQQVQTSWLRIGARCSPQRRRASTQHVR